MKRIFKLILFLSTTLFFFFIVLFLRTVHFLLFVNPQWIFPHLTKQWGAAMVWLLQIKVTCQFKQDNVIRDHYLSVSNHQSYLDVVIIASQIPSLFVAKKDVQSWPLLGWLSSLGGTLFIDRRSFRGAKNSSVEIEQALRNNINVHIFPEGTSNNGESIFPFKASLFKAAVSSNGSILPLSLNYERINNAPVDRSNRDHICWYGEMTFMDHFWNILSIDSIDASIIVHPVISTMNFQTSKEVSVAAYQVVSDGVNKFP